MSFIAVDESFAGYAAWASFALGTAMNDGHPVGPEVGYRNQAPAETYRVGSILVKEVRIGDAPQQWELFGMAKRGGVFNAYGARGWEFFTLRLDDELRPVIVSRGSNPADGDTPLHGYGWSVGGVTCNRCHAAEGTELHDHVLSPQLQP